MAIGDPLSVAQVAEDLPYRLTGRERVTPVVTELHLCPVAGTLTHKAGQYGLLADARHEMPWRSYSIANAPEPDGVVTMLISRVVGGRLSTWVHDDLKVGDEVLLSGPYGTFVLAESTRHPLLLLCGGSGLAPARALAAAALAQAPERSVTLFFSARTAADRISHELFVAWQDRYPGFRYLVTLTREPSAPLHDRVPVLLARLLGPLSEHEVFVAGAPGFVSACTRALRSQGVRPTKLHAEPFFAEPQPWSGPPPVVPAAEGES